MPKYCRGILETPVKEKHLQETRLRFYSPISLVVSENKKKDESLTLTFTPHLHKQGSMEGQILYDISRGQTFRQRRAKCLCGNLAQRRVTNHFIHWRI